MHRKAVFALAGVFLVVALVIPPIILILQAQQTITIVEQNTGHITSGNVTFTQGFRENLTSNIYVIGVVEAVFLSLFVVTLYIGINHTHPEH